MKGVFYGPTLNPNLEEKVKSGGNSGVQRAKQRVDLHGVTAGKQRLTGCGRGGSVPLPVKKDSDVPCNLLYGLIPGTLVCHSNPDLTFRRAFSRARGGTEIDSARRNNK